MTSCAGCGTAIPPAPAQGRPAVYCSGACRQRAYRQRQIPAALRRRPRWVRWALTADGRKLPMQAGANRAASVADRRTWSSYAEASASRVGSGLGFVLGDGIGCIDLDGCLSADGTLSPLAREILAANPDAWVERSMSGRGLHVWGRLEEAPGRRTPGLEIYSRGRFIALTQIAYRGGGLPALVLPEEASRDHR